MCNMCSKTKKTTETWAQGSETMTWSQRQGWKNNHIHVCSVWRFQKRSPATLSVTAPPSALCYAKIGQGVRISHITSTFTQQLVPSVLTQSSRVCLFAQEHVGVRLRTFSVVTLAQLMGMFLRFGQRDTSILMTSSIGDPAEKLRDDMSPTRERAELRSVHYFMNWLADIECRYKIR